MRLKRREVTDFDEIVQMIDHADILHLGIKSENLPYIVPVSFGYLVKEDDRIILYFHGAKEGRKYELLKEHPLVSIVIDQFNGYKKEQYGYTAKYESVMAKGYVVELYGEEKLIGLNSLMKHCGYETFEKEECANYEHTATFKIELEDISAKKRI